MIADDASENVARIPVIQEDVHISKRQVETEQVRVSTSFESESVTVHDSVTREHIEIRRIAFDREVAEMPAIREEEDCTIVPVVEERLVVEKRLFLVEEIHLVRHRSTEVVTMPVEVRRTTVNVERSIPDINQEEDV